MSRKPCLLSWITLFAVLTLLAFTAPGCSTNNLTPPCTGACVAPTILFASSPAFTYAYPVTSSGALGAPLANSGAASSFSVALTPLSPFLFQPDIVSRSVLSFSINTSTGALTPLATQSLGASSQGGVGAAVTSTGSALYVSDFNGGIVGFRVSGATGELTGLAGSLLPVSQSPRMLAIDPAGKFLYANDPNDQVLVYSIQMDGSLAPVPGSPFLLPVGSKPEGVAVDPSGNFLYVTLAKAGKVAGFAIDAGTGALTPVPGSPVAAGKLPEALGITANHNLYAINAVDNTISAYQISPADGHLTAIAGSPFPTGAPINSALVAPFAGSVASDHAGTQLWIGAPWSTSIASFAIDGTTGALTAKGVTTLPANTPPGQVSLAFYEP